MKKVFFLIILLGMFGYSVLAEMKMNLGSGMEMTNSKGNNDKMNSQEHRDMMNSGKIDEATTTVSVDVMTPVNEILAEQFMDYAGYENYAHEIMMADNSKYLTNDTGNIFTVYMILHHNGAIVTSSGIESITKDSRIRKLATGIVKSQTKEVKDMQKLLSSGELKGNENSAFYGEIQSIMDRMMSTMQVPSEGMSPEESTRIYLQNMIIHHEGAIKMAQAYLKTGKNPKLLEMCKNIVKNQQDEINQMQKFLKGQK